MTMITVFNNKGGIGKTNFVHNAAYAVAKRKKGNDTSYKPVDDLVNVINHRKRLTKPW